MRWVVLALTLSAALPAAAEIKRDPAVPRAFQIANPCPSTGLSKGACPGWIRDHIVALCRGGPDTVENLQWQTVEDAKAKDRWECKP